jgi:hypothetical protein
MEATGAAVGGLVLVEECQPRFLELREELVPADRIEVVGALVAEADAQDAGIIRIPWRAPQQACRRAPRPSGESDRDQWWLRIPSSALLCVLGLSKHQPRFVGFVPSAVAAQKAPAFMPA